MLSETVVCPVLSVRRSVCDVGVLWPNGLMDQDETWHAGRPMFRVPKWNKKVHGCKSVEIISLCWT